MSTLPITDLLATPSPECVATQDLTRKCLGCGDPLPTAFGRPRKYCKGCNPQRNFSRDMNADLERELKLVAKNIGHRHLNRDKYLGFDGKYEGPLNQCFTTEVAFRKDKAGAPVGADCPTPALEKKFVDGVVVHSEGEYQAKWHSAFPHSAPMHRVYNSFCTSCADAVVDSNTKTVRITRGVYLPIEHKCNSVRVYDLAGKLLEVKSL